MLNLVLVGLNHRTAEISVRERAAFAPERLPDALLELARQPGVEEAMIVSTCNRVELLVRVREGCPGTQLLEDFLRRESGLDATDLRPRLYCHVEHEAVRHVLRVACSLDSMVLGEPQILGQVKSFYGLAVEAQTVGAFLNTVDAVGLSCRQARAFGHKHRGVLGLGQLGRGRTGPEGLWYVAENAAC